MFTEFFNTQMNYIRAVRENFGHAKHEEVTVKPAEKPTESEEKDPTQEEGPKQQTETQTVKKSKKATV